MLKPYMSWLVWLGISNGNLQEGNFRCDANVSVKKPDLIHLVQEGD